MYLQRLLFEITHIVNHANRDKVCVKYERGQGGEKNRQFYFFSKAYNLVIISSHGFVADKTRDQMISMFALNSKNTFMIDHT